MFSFAMASQRTTPMGPVALVPSQVFEMPTKVVVRVLGYVNMILELYLGLYALGYMLDIARKDSIMYNEMPVKKKMDLSLYAVILCASVMFSIFCTVLIAGTTLVNRTYVKSFIGYSIFHVQISIVLFYYINYEMSDVLQNKFKTLILVIITKMTALMTLPLACLCCHQMSKRLPRVLIPYYGYAPRMMAHIRRTTVPRASNDDNDFHASDEILNKVDPPPKYDAVEV